jgi:hypothetical protein
MITNESHDANIHTTIIYVNSELTQPPRKRSH